MATAEKQGGNRGQSPAALKSRNRYAAKVGNKTTQTNKVLHILTKNQRKRQIASGRVLPDKWKGPKSGGGWARVSAGRNNFLPFLRLYRKGDTCLPVMAYENQYYHRHIQQRPHPA